MLYDIAIQNSGQFTNDYDWMTEHKSTTNNKITKTITNNSQRNNSHSIKDEEEKEQIQVEIKRKNISNRPVDIDDLSMIAHCS